MREPRLKGCTCLHFFMSKLMSDKTKAYFDIGVYDKKSLVSVKISGNKCNINFYQNIFSFRSVEVPLW